jgi:succinyl-CoA synthetase beta subunit
MKLVEHETKAILKKYGIAVPQGKVTQTPEEAMAITTELGRPVFLKSQVAVSGRGKAGGVMEAADGARAKEIAVSLIGSKIRGIIVNSLLIEEKVEIQEQLYASIAIDRQFKRLVILASRSGGVDIEEVAASHPENVARYCIDPLSGFGGLEAVGMLERFNLEPADAARFAATLVTLYRAALDNDAELLEINPLVKTTRGDLVAVDARLIVDDNAIFRHPEFAERSLHRVEDTWREAEARKRGFSYVDLDGDIGIIGNGAGLVMAILDLVHLLGGRPANFLDIGGGAQIEAIKDGVMLVISKQEVKSVLINIFGGITRCDLVATGVIEALKASPVKKPMTVRMLGTNEKEGQEILHQNGIGFYRDMEEAARVIIQSLRISS